MKAPKQPTMLMVDHQLTETELSWLKQTWAANRLSTVPCPFCGSTYAAKVETKGGWRLRCSCCDAETGVARSDEVLRAMWERRPVMRDVPCELSRAVARSWAKRYTGVDECTVVRALLRLLGK